MIEHFLFLAYFSASFLALAVVALAVLLIKHKSSKNYSLFAATKNFIACSLAIGILYSFSFYRSFFLNEYAWNVFLRVIDISLFILLIYFWSKFIMELLVPNSIITFRAKRITSIVIFLCLIFSSANYFIFVDEYYFVESDFFRPYVVTIQAIICICLTCITIFYVIKSLQNLNKKSDKIFILLISFFLSFNGLWNGIIVIGLFAGSFTLRLESEMFDPTSIMLASINLCTLIYVYKHDFSTIYFMNSKDTSEPSTSDDIPSLIDRVSHDYMLTQREREVLSYAFLGYTNPDIAQALFISKNTVRNHMHSIFEKLDVATRIDMIHLINSLKI